MSSVPAQPRKSPTDEHEILFQNWFKSVGPRTYAAQVKKASNGNHYLVMTEGKRDEKTGEVRKTRLFLYSEDFAAFFKMLHETAVFIRENPVPADVKNKRDRYWAKQDSKASPPNASQGAPRAPKPSGNFKRENRAPAARQKSVTA